MKMKKKLLILFCLIASLHKIHSQTNWELLNPKLTASTGKDVDFVTNEIGYIITSQELLQTLDAGNNWSKKQNIPSGNDLSFKNTTGYVVGDNGYVLKSVNSGTSWTQVATGFNDSFNTVTIIDDDTVILSSSNSIVKTNDGGSSWVKLMIPNGVVNKTFFTNALTGHAVCNSGIIRKTVDGGQTWYTTLTTNISPANFFTVYFVNQSVGFATREHSEMFKTTDGGETWMQIADPGEAVYDLHFLNQNDGFATGEYGATYKTTDGGNTWTHIFFLDAYYGDSSMYGIYFQDNNIGYATGARGRIMKTTNGGVSWTAQSENYNDFNDLKIFDSGTGFARSGNNYYKTTDFGDHWSYISSVNHFSYCSGFYFVSENIGYSVGGGTNSVSGDIYKTTDGGITWNRLSIYIDEGISSVFFIDENVGFISGGFNQRKVMKTTNGGATWTQVFNQVFGQMQFIDNQIGYAHRVGYSTGIMYKTVDGGITWNESIEVEEDINAFDFVDQDNGYFVGDQGIIYKTTDGGTNWEKLEIPYEWYTQINFLTKNIGFIADEEGKLYKTENGGYDWEYLTQQYAINSIALVNGKIYTAGTSGKIYRSTVEYETMILRVKPAENLTNSSARLLANVASNGDSISNIQFEYSLDYSFNTIVATTPATVGPNDALNVSVDLANLDTNVTYYYRLRASQNSNIAYSQVLSFTTLPDYEITTGFTYNYSSTSAVISGMIVSNGYDVTNVEFEYGLNANDLDRRLDGTPASILGNTTENVTASLINLEPETRYYFRIKARHQGQDIFGNVQSFTTRPEYRIVLYSPYINGSDVTLSAFLTSYDQPISDIVFEYGNMGFENQVSTNPSQVDANRFNDISATLTNLDNNINYRYRMKGMHNGQVIYSQEGFFNLSGAVIFVSGIAEETQTNTLELKGLINSQGTYLTNIHFEYGTTESFGSSVAGTPDYAYGYNTSLISSFINNISPNQTYYYRLVATNNANTIYSNTYQYTTGTLHLTDSEADKEIAIYPNPATDFLNFKSNTSENVKSIEFYNTLGQRIYTEAFLNIADVKVDVSNLTRGIYFVKVIFESSKTVSSKLILR